MNKPKYDGVRVLKAIKAQFKEHTIPLFFGEVRGTMSTEDFLKWHKEFIIENNNYYRMNNKELAEEAQMHNCACDTYELEQHKITLKKNKVNRFSFS